METSKSLFVALVVKLLLAVVVAAHPLVCLLLYSQSTAFIILLGELPLLIGLQLLVFGDCLMLFWHVVQNNMKWLTLISLNLY